MRNDVKHAEVFCMFDVTLSLTFNLIFKVQIRRPTLKQPSHWQVSVGLQKTTFNGVGLTKSPIGYCLCCRPGICCPSRIDLDQSTDSLFDQYNSTMTQLIDKHAPAQQRSIKPRPHAPWYTPELRKSAIDSWAPKSILSEILDILSNDIENEVKGQIQGHEKIHHIWFPIYPQLIPELQSQ